MNVTLVLGTAREGRVSAAVAVSLANLAKTAGHQVSFVDVRNFVREPQTTRLKDYSEPPASALLWQQTVETTDAFIFVIPEYNHSFPGEWKLLMDTLYREYVDKVAYVATVSDGAFGGVRVMEQILPVLINFGIRVASARLHVAKADTVFTEDGAFVDEATALRFQKFIDSIK